MRLAGFVCSVVVLGSAYWTWGQDSNRPAKGRGQRVNQEELIKRFDKNGDGRLDEQERTAARRVRGKKGKGRYAEILKRFDKDGDGRLSEEERGQARRARGEGNPQRAGAQRRQDPPRVNVQSLLRRFDKDGDQKLNQEELSALLRSMRRQRGESNRPAGVDRRPAGRDAQNRARRDQNRPRRDRPQDAPRPRRPRVDREKLIERFDKDGDGRLDDQERSQAREALRKQGRRRGKKATN